MREPMLLLAGEARTYPSCAAHTRARAQPQHAVATIVSRDCAQMYAQSDRLCLHSPARHWADAG